MMGLSAEGLPLSEIIVASAYQGIPGIAHGGYVAGLMAQHVPNPARVRLRQPPPLETPLSLQNVSDSLQLRDRDGRVIMEGTAGGDLLDRLPDVTLDEARSRRPHPRFDQHPYPVCFVCGTRRDDGFGLRISAPDSEGVAAGVWIPSGPLLPEREVVPAAFVWAVVDCLTAWSFADHWGDESWWPAVTGQIEVAVGAEVRRDQPYVATGRLAGRDGRRVTIEAAVRDADGGVCAHAEATWIVVPETPQASGGATSST